MMEEKKTAPDQGAEPVIIGEPRQCSEVESYRHVLRSLLHYHERMMLGSVHCEHTGIEKACPVTELFDPYAEALKEAIRCIEIVHKDELLGG